MSTPNTLRGNAKYKANTPNMESSYRSNSRNTRYIIFKIIKKIIVINHQWQ